MNKLVINDTFDYGVEEPLVNIVDDPDVMSRKVAGAVRESWGDMKPEKGRVLVHIIALGDFEKVGDNSNHDAFEEAVTKRSHSDFVKRARLYRHHKKVAEDKKDGDVIRSAHNDKMGRVELVLSAIEEKCADWLGELEKGGKVNFSMGWSCFDPTAKVKTIDGYKEIKNITTSDLVLDGNGEFSKVTSVIKSPLGERKVISIKGHTWHDEILATNDHRILVLKEEDLRKEIGSRKAGFDYEDAPLQWVESEDIKKGDYLVRPVIEAGGAMPIDNDVAYMLGHYLRDGSPTKNTDHSVVITTHVNDEDIFQKMVSICLAKKWDFTVYHLSEALTHRKKMPRTLKIRDTRFTIMCKDLCGELEEKKLNSRVWRDWDEENFKHFLGGYIDADGSYDARHGHIRISTILDDLADSIQQALFTVGIAASAWKDFWKQEDSKLQFKNKKDYAWVVYVSPSSTHLLNNYSVRVQPQETKREQQVIFLNKGSRKYLACRVKSISLAENQPDTVYCLEVEGPHTFTVSGFVVHNCTDGDICSICGHRAHKRSEYCFVPETHITMRDGTTKLINEIKVGDIVLSSCGKPTRVIKLFSREINEDIVRLKSSIFGKDIVCTKNHPILTLPAEASGFYSIDNCSYGSKDNSVPVSDRLGFENFTLSPEFVNAENILEKDFVFAPIINEEHLKKLQSFVDEEFAWVCGPYLVGYIVKKEIEPYCGSVFNFETEDGTYVANGIAVHNCDHIKKNASAPYGLGKILPDGRKCFTFNRDGHWNDISYVDRGADMTAMDLAKIASISGDDGIGGAELFELLGYCEDEKVSNKIALARRINSIVGEVVKRGSVVPLCKTGMLSNAAIESILTNSPKEIFSMFFKKGYVMPFDLFCESLSSISSPEMKSHIKSACDNFGEYASEIYSNKSKLEELAKLGTFDSIPSIKFDLSTEAEKELDKVAQIVNNDEIEYSLLDIVINKEASQRDKSPKTKVAKILVENYIAYKISALADKTINNAVLFDLFLLN